MISNNLIMRLIQSLWSCNQTNLMHFNAGWVSPEYNLMSWSLSCLQLQQYYADVVLYTDSVGAKMLIDTLRLPYTEVVCELDKLNSSHAQLWALPKIHAYAKQDNPFLHIDGDVFIWKKFDSQLLRGGLIAQNEEAATDYYERILESLESELSYFPSEIDAERKSQLPIHAFNAGIMGGSDTAFFKNYSVKALEFVGKNVRHFPKINVSNFNIFFEQYLFYCLARKEGKKVEVLIPEVIYDNRYKGFGDFIEIPHNKKYLHLIGDYKRNNSVCNQLANRLRLDYPEYYYRIIALFKNNKAPLLKDYFWIGDILNEDHLTANKFLKAVNLKNELQVHVEEDSKNRSEPVCFRIHLLKSILESTLYYKGGNSNSESTEFYTKDINQFEQSLVTIIENKFNNVARNYLYARDISNARYAEYIFGEPETIYDKIILSDDLNEIIESQFDWTIMDVSPKLVQGNVIGFLEQEVSLKSIYTLVVPECDQYGYSVTNIDELDCLLLQTVKEPKSIRDLFEQIKFAFDPDDLASSVPEFEKLIFGRIKNGLLNKSIKVFNTMAHD